MWGADRTKETPLLAFRVKEVRQRRGHWVKEFCCDLVFVLDRGSLEWIQVSMQSINRETEVEGREGKKNHSTVQQIFLIHL